jgi:RNA polymerase sigma-70 factor (ECF subfamily)
MAVNVAAGSAVRGVGRPNGADQEASLDVRGDPADAEALRRIAAGDEEGLRDAFSRHWEIVARTAFRITGDEDGARDAAQEAYIRLHRKPPPPETALRAWLCRVAANQAVNDIRSGRRRFEREARHEDRSRTASADAIGEANLRAERALVREVLLGLPERSRDLLVLRAEGFRYHEIAAAIGVAPGSIGTLLVRAEKAFRESYEARRGGA